MFCFFLSHKYWKNFLNLLTNINYGIQVERTKWRSKMATPAPVLGVHVTTTLYVIPCVKRTEISLGRSHTTGQDISLLFYVKNLINLLQMIFFNKHKKLDIKSE